MEMWTTAVLRIEDIFWQEGGEGIVRGIGLQHPQIKENFCCVMVRQF